MSPAMMVFAGSRVVGPMLRAKCKVPPRLDCGIERCLRRASRLGLAEALRAASGPNSTAAEPATPYFSRSRRVTKRWPGVGTNAPFLVRASDRSI